VKQNNKDRKKDLQKNIINILGILVSAILIIWVFIPFLIWSSNIITGIWKYIGERFIVANDYISEKKETFLTWYLETPTGVISTFALVVSIIALLRNKKPTLSEKKEEINKIVISVLKTLHNEKIIDDFIEKTAKNIINSQKSENIDLLNRIDNLEKEIENLKAKNIDK